MDSYRLDGRVSIITGGGQGIGLACAELFAKAGARVVIVDVSAKAAEAGQAELRKKNLDCATAVADVTDSKMMSDLADKIVSDYGRVDTLVANAGIAMSGTNAEDISDDLWLRVNDVNYNGVFWSNRAFGRHMLAAGRGTIINMGSMSGLIINRPQSQSYYNASKAAVHHLTRSLAAEWADRGVRVNCVAPTYIETPLLEFASETPDIVDKWRSDTPMKRFGKPEEIAAVVHFLACDASSLLTGSLIVADGGYTLW